MAGELEPLLLARSAISFAALPIVLAQIELRALEIETPRLDLREVEQVVDQSPAATAPDESPSPGSPAVPARQLRLQRSVVHARESRSTAFDPWLMFARNALLVFRRLFGVATCDFQLLDQLRETRRRSSSERWLSSRSRSVVRHRFLGRLALRDVARRRVDDLMLAETVQVHISQRSVPSLCR